MNLAELIAHVGSANVKVQRIDESFTEIKTNKKGITKITFETDAVSANDYFEGHPPPAMHGLVIWIPRDKLP